jgi:multidrug resistance protein
MANSHSSDQARLIDQIPKATFIGLFTANMAAMLGMGILLPLLSPFAHKLGASETIIGAIFAGFAVARGIFSPLIGRVSDRYGRRNFMFTGLTLYVLLSIGYILLHSLLVLAILWFFQGVASSMVAPIAQSYIGDITPEGKEGRVMNFFYLGQFGGIAAGPVIGGYLTDNISWNAPFYVMIGTTFIGLALIYFVVPRQPASERKKPEENNAQDSFIEVLKDRDMQGILSYMIGRGFYRWGFNSFFPIYAITVASLTKGQVGLVITCYMVAGALFQYPCGWLADRLPNQKAALIGIGGCAAALTMAVVPFLTQLIWFMVLMFCMGIFSALSRASTVAIRTERGRIHGMGAVTGVYTASFSWGEVLGPLGFGAIAEAWSIPISFYIGAAVGVLTAAAAFWLLHRNRMRQAVV